MKKFMFMLILLLIPFISCKKEGPKKISFSISFARMGDAVHYDSVAYALINYSYASEFKDAADRNDPEVFSNSIEVEKPYTLLVEADQTCVIKKFDLVSKSGEVIFYVPYGIQYYYVDNIQFQGQGLPLNFIAGADAAYTIMVTKK